MFAETDCAASANCDFNLKSDIGSASRNASSNKSIPRCQTSSFIYARFKFFRFVYCIALRDRRIVEPMNDSITGLTRETQLPSPNSLILLCTPEIRAPPIHQKPQRHEDRREQNG